MPTKKTAKKAPAKKTPAKKEPAKKRTSSKPFAKTKKGAKPASSSSSRGRTFGKTAARQPSKKPTSSVPIAAVVAALVDGVDNGGPSGVGIPFPGAPATEESEVKGEGFTMWTTTGESRVHFVSCTWTTTHRMGVVQRTARRVFIRREDGTEEAESAIVASVREQLAAAHGPATKVAHVGWVHAAGSDDVTFQAMKDAPKPDYDYPGGITLSVMRTVRS